MDRRIKMSILGSLIALLGGVLGTSAWLFWPLPNPEFDWRSGADELASQNQNTCIDFEIMIFLLPSVDPDAAEDFLNERPLVERCPALDEVQPTGMKTLGNAAIVEQEMRLGISRAREYIIGLQESNTAYRQSGDIAANFGPTTAYWFHTWQRNRTSRQLGNAGWIGWPELVFVSRCDVPLFYAEQSKWDEWHRSISTLVDLPQTSSAWDHRREWCSDFATKQAEAIGQTEKDAGADLATVEARRGLTMYYEGWAELWD